MGIGSSLCACGCGSAVNQQAGRRFVIGHNARKQRGDGPNPSGLCQCGCGKPAEIAKKSLTSTGAVEGKPLRFAHSHWSRVQDDQLRGYRLNRHKYEHRLIVERAIGKPLPSRAQVHHVDGNPRNNENCNLVVCEDRAYHKLLHRRQRIRDAGGNPNTDSICFKCKRVRPLGMFYIRRSNGLPMYTCKTCALSRDRSIEAAQKRARRLKAKQKQAGYLNAYHEQRISEYREGL